MIGEEGLAAQAKKAFQNLKAVLDEAGATPNDVVKLNLYVVNYQPKDLAVVDAGIRECFGADRQFVSTLVGVQALAREGMLFEVEAIAVVD